MFRFLAYDSVCRNKFSSQTQSQTSAPGTEALPRLNAVAKVRVAVTLVSEGTMCGCPASVGVA